MTHDLPAAIARAKGRDESGALPAVPTPISAAALARAWQELKPGEVAPDGTVYLGRHTLVSRTFNVYAARQDLPGLLTYDDARAQIAALTDLHGHPGEDYEDADKLAAALTDGSYQGGWVIPTYAMLAGNLRAHREAEALEPTLSRRDKAGESGWYWSSNLNGVRNDCRVSLDIFSSASFSRPKGNKTLQPCRPFRLEPAP